MTSLQGFKRRLLAQPTVAATYAVGHWLVRRARPAQETASAEYAYSVWLRHFVRARELGVTPRVVAELGPGASLGVGLCALLTGSERYIALDVVRYASSATNLRVFDELIEMLRRGVDIPGEPTHPTIPSSSFPIPRDEINRALASRRIATIRERVVRGDLEYVAPWNDPLLVDAGSVDVVVSQAVMEHVEDLPGTYQAIATWLRPGGISAHQIDFDSHSRAPLWNGHWAYPEEIWKVVAGRRSPINRAPLSWHLEAIEAAGLQVEKVERNASSTPGVLRQSLASRWAALSDDDLACRSAFVQARRPHAKPFPQAH